VSTASPTDAPSASVVADPAVVAPAITLRLATPEGKDLPSQPYLDHFASEVARASGGSMAVDVINDAGGHEPDLEQQVASQVIAGTVDMALVPVRSWSDVGVTSLQALGAPFLIDNDALLTAVTTDDALVQPLLAGMKEQGLVGLAVWPEGLRHPFTFEQNGAPLLSPGDFKDQKITALPTKAQREVIETLGATVVDFRNRDAALSDGSLRGGEAGLQALSIPGFPTSTVDVTLYPKIEVMVIEDAVWSRLSAEQQAIVQAAAIAARDQAVKEHPSTANLAKKYCAAGGTVVLAGAANVASFMDAVKPIYDRLAGDPTTAAALDAIRALKQSTPPSTPASACRPSVSAAATIPPVEPGPEIGLIPDGTYQQPLQTYEDLLAKGLDERNARNNAGTMTLVVSGSSFGMTTKQESGQVEGCFFTMTDEGDRIRTSENQGCQAGNPPDGVHWAEFRWVLDGDQLTMKTVDEHTGRLIEIVAYDGIWGGPWTKTE
jgi:TRAP-type C4-dicarboxylate transport system substrate-binding protein